MLQITVSPAADGAAIAFSYDRDLVAAVKDAFPKARWNAGTRVWTVPGKTAVRRAEAWAAGRADTARALGEQEAAARASVPTNAIASRWVSRTRDGWVVRTPYAESIVAALRSVPGGDWIAAQKAWLIPFRSTEALLSCLPGVEAAAEAAQARLDDERLSREASVAQDRAERLAARAAALPDRSRRMLVMAHEAPSEGALVRRNGEAMVVEGLGKVFVIRDEDTSAHGLMPGNDYRARYAYLRPATVDEAGRLASLEVEEAAEAARQAASRAAAADACARFRDIADEIRRAGDMPRSNLAGARSLLRPGSGRRERFLDLLEAGDGALWLVQSNGPDGDDWSQNNLAGAIGWRLTGDLAATLAKEVRSLADVLGDGRL